MKKFVLVLIFTAISIGIHAQITFKRAYFKSQISEASYVQQTSDGGYIAIGHTQIDNSSSTDVFVIKTNAFGDPLWINSFDLPAGFGPSQDAGKSIIETPSGDYLIAGYVHTNSGYRNALLMKIDSNGNQVWAKKFEAGVQMIESFYSIRPTSDGNYILIGEAKLTASSTATYLVKVDENGNTLMSKMFDNGLGAAGAICQTTDGGFIISCRSNESLHKVDASGNHQWAKVYDTNVTNAWGTDILEMHDGNYLLSARQVVLKVSPVGDTLWIRKLGSYAIYGMDKTLDGGYVFVGTGGLFFKTDSQLNILWAYIHYGHIKAVRQTVDQGFILAGESFTSGTAHLHLIKTDSLGQSNCNETAISLTWLTQPLLFHYNMNPISYTGDWQFNIALTPSIGASDSILCLQNTIPDEPINDSVLEIGIFPVPASDLLTLQFEKVIENGNIKIFNAIGKLTYYSDINSELNMSINLNGFTNGVYYIKLHNGESTIHKKFIVSHN